MSHLLSSRKALDSRGWLQHSAGTYGTPVTASSAPLDGEGKVRINSPRDSLPSVRDQAPPGTVSSMDLE